MFTDPCKANLADYRTFLLSIGITDNVLPGYFSGLGTLAISAPQLSVTAVTTGTVLSGAVAVDAEGLIPFCPTPAVVTGQASGTAGGIGTYTLSLNPSAAEPNAEAINCYNSQLVTSFLIAQDIVNIWLMCAPLIYVLALYNLGADRLINFAMDPPDQNFFKQLRANFKINTFSPGVVAQTSDQGTAVDLLNPESMESFTLQDLQYLKTPYGRQYMAFAHMYGPNIWGVA